MGPVSVPSKMRRCSGGRSSAKALRAVQMIITKNEVELAVIFRRSGFGNHFDPPAPWPREFSRVRILIDPHFLNHRGRNFPGGFQAINQHRRAACPSRTASIKLAMLAITSLPKTGSLLSASRSNLMTSRFSAVLVLTWPDS